MTIIWKSDFFSDLIAFEDLFLVFIRSWVFIDVLLVDENEIN